MYRLVGLFVLCAAAFAQHHHHHNWDLNSFVCGSIDRYDCTNYGKHEECGTDDVTYANRCYYNKAHCKDNTIHVAYMGVCGTKPLNPNNPDLTGTAAQLHFFCDQMRHEHCSTDKNYVCASNGQSYINLCEFEKAKCMNDGLTVKSAGQCSSD